MLTLVIETATERGGFAFFKGSKKIYEEHFPFGLNNSKNLFPALQKSGINLHEIQRIGVGIGPGSYTGIRVSAITGKILAYALRIPLIGVSTLHTFIPKQEGKFSVMLDAKIGGVYLISGENKGGITVYYTTPELVPLGKLEGKLRDTPLILTPHPTILQERIQAQLPCLTFQWEEAAPDFTKFFELTEEKYKERNYSLDGSLELLYLRKTQAEIEKEKLIEAI